MTQVKKSSGNWPVFPAWSDFFKPEKLFNEELFGKRFFERPMPAVNVNETDKAIEMELSIPGMDKNDVKVEMEDDVLTITGEKKSEKETKEKNYTRKEFSYGSFKRSFRLPDFVAQDKVDAKFQNGLLKLTIPKNHVEKPKKVRKISIA